MLINNQEVKVAAIDFDGTLFEEKYPDIGEPIWSTIEYVRSLKEEGVQLILWTNREGELLEEAVEACKSVGLVFNAINQNLQWRTELYGNDCRKVGADIYIDDKAINPRDIPCNILDRILSEDKYVEAYRRNPYFKKCIDSIKLGNTDYLEEVYLLSNSISSIADNIQEMLSDPPFSQILM